MRIPPITGLGQFIFGLVIVHFKNRMVGAVEMNYLKARSWGLVATSSPFASNLMNSIRNDFKIL